MDEKNALIIGIGDIILPGVLIIAIHNTINQSYYIILASIVGTIIGLIILMFSVIKNKSLPGLPFLISGTIIGYILSSLYLFGELKGLSISLFQI